MHPLKEEGYLDSAVGHFENFVTKLKKVGSSVSYRNIASLTSIMFLFNFLK